MWTRFCRVGLLTVTLLTIASPPAPAQQHTPDLAGLDLYLQGVEQFGFAGTVLVARGGDVLFAKGYGLANRETIIPNTESATFETASVTKLFTAAMILRLAADRRIELDAPVDRYLPSEYPSGAPTISELLTHTSGLPREFEQENRALDARTFLAGAMAARKATSRPAWAYSNAGYAVLAMVIEAVTSRSYAAALEDLLVRPLQLSATSQLGAQLTETMLLTRGYVGTRLASDLKDHPVRLNALGAQGVLSSVTDLHQVAWRWLSGELFPDGVTGRSLAPDVPIADGLRQAFFWRVEGPPEAQHYFHHGDHIPMGYSSSIHYYPAMDDLIVILLSNAAERGGLGQRHAVLDDVLTLAQGGWVPSPPVVRECAGQREVHVGTLSTAAGPMKVSLDRDGCALATPGNQALADLLFGLEGETRVERDTQTERAREVSEGVVRGESGPLAKYLADSTRVGTYLEALAGWFDELKVDHGQIRRVREMATIPRVWPSGRSESVLQIVLSDGHAETVTFEWDDEGIVGLSGDTPDLAIHLRMLAPGRFVSYDIYRHVTRTIAVDPDGARVRVFAELRR